MKLNKVKYPREIIIQKKRVNAKNEEIKNNNKKTRRRAETIVNNIKMLASKLKMVMMNNFMRCCLILWLISSSSVVSSIKIEGGAYQNIVIEIQNDVPRTNCLDFLRSLQVSFTFNLSI